MAIKQHKAKGGAKGFMLQEVPDRYPRVNGTIDPAGNQIDTPLTLRSQRKYVILQDLAYVQRASQGLCDGGWK